MYIYTQIYIYIITHLDFAGLQDQLHNRESGVGRGHV